MFEYTKEDLNIMAKEFNFNRDTLEKVIRLIKILDFINTDSQIKEKLVLKGGTDIPDGMTFPYPEAGEKATITFTADPITQGLYYYSIDDGE